MDKEVKLQDMYDRHTAEERCDDCECECEDEAEDAGEWHSEGTMMNGTPEP